MARYLLASCVFMGLQMIGRVAAVATDLPWTTPNARFATLVLVSVARIGTASCQLAVFLPLPCCRARPCCGTGRIAPSAEAAADIAALTALSAGSSSSQPSTPKDEQPTKAHGPGVTTPQKPPSQAKGAGQNSPGCAVNAANTNVSSVSWTLMLLMFGSILHLRQRP